MTDIDFKRLTSEANLRLAWRRITTASNFSYKKYSRELFHIYELAVDENLADLYQRLSGNSFVAQAPKRIFVPKKSGLQRGISLLHIEDQIVYQAVANIIAEKVRARRAPYVGREVFSNFLNTDPRGIFFLQDWKPGYRAYIDCIRKYHHDGFRWVAQFDLAAFYDTISHELLCQTVSPQMPRSANWPIVETWFQKWANPRETWPLNHGIPQGPMSSDFFAEVFLLPVDKVMAKNHRYIRYVDDIRVFGKSEDEVLAAVRHLELLCRERGLIPQGQKFEVLETVSVNDAFGSLASFGDTDDEGERYFGMPQSKAERVFKESLAGSHGRRIVDKSKARYALFRGPPSPKIRRWVLKLLPRHPEHIEAFVFYLRKLRRTKKLIAVCSRSANKSPFDFVRGELLHFLAERMTKAQARLLLDTAKEIAANKSAGISAKWGAMEFLCRCEVLGLGNFSRFIYYQPGFVQALTMKSLPMAALKDARASVLSESSVEAGLALASRLVADDIDLATVGMDPRRCKSQVQHVLAALGVTPRIAASADPISELLHDRYNCGAARVWRALFGVEYGHAMQQLRRAEALYDMGRSEWLNYQDSFNHALFIALQVHLNRLVLPGACATITHHGQLVKYGSMIKGAHPFPTNRPVIATALEACHIRRNSLPSSHPYDEKTRVRTKPLRRGEQSSLAAKLQRAYREIIVLCVAYNITN